MKRNKRAIALLCVTAGGLAASLATPALADHAWGDYHWQRADPELLIPVIDNTTGVWISHVADAVADWNGSAYINSPLATGNADPSCALRSGEIHVCNDAYGDNGWLGIATISVSRGRDRHIVAGSTKLNDTYFDAAPYNTPTWRQLVTCQEIGHDYGLGHQNEDFSTDLTTSCMEYTDLPEGNEHPDAHDLEMLAQIYAHSHGGGDTSGPGGGGNGGGKGRKLGVPGNSPADWGTPIGRDAQGRANVYSREENGYEIITHVTWAIGEGPDDHNHRNTHPRIIDFHD